MAKNSVPIYRDGSVVATVTGVKNKSANVKTGDMIQLSVLVEKIDPVSAMKSGADRANCGDCKRSSKANGGDGSCYVTTCQMPLAVYRSTVDMPTVSDPRLPNKSIRLGAYGDPCKIPLATLRKVTDGRRYTGYTHGWRDCDEGYAQYCMASVDTPEERRMAKAMGYRTFRVLPSADTPLEDGELTCLNTSHGIQCADCGLCNGMGSPMAKDIAIVGHGPIAPKVAK